MVDVNNIRAANDARLRAESLSQIEGVRQSKEERNLCGHAKLFAKQRSRRLESAEPVLKRSIPVLIIAFLIGRRALI